MISATTISFSNHKTLQQFQSELLSLIQSDQLATGEFKTLLLFPQKSENGWIDVGSSVFITSCVGILLSDIKNEVAKSMALQAAYFVKQQMSPFGLWRFYPHHGLFKFNTPLDVDDTALASILLKKFNLDFPDNKPLLLKQLDNKGNFLIWYMPRWRYLSQLKFLKFLFTDLKLSYPLFFPMKGRTTAPLARYNDSEHAVTANVLLYLGQTEATQKSIFHLAEDLLFGPEINAHFYPEFLFIYYHVSRLYAMNMEAFANLKHKIIHYFEENDALINASVFNQAVAAITLMNFKILPEKTGLLIQQIAKTSTGNIALPYPYFCTKDRNMMGGSVALTCAMVYVALDKFLNSDNE